MFLKGTAKDFLVGVMEQVTVFTLHCTNQSPFGVCRARQVGRVESRKWEGLF